MASLDDLLTTQKNGVIAINGLGQTLLRLYANFKTVPIFSGAAATSATTLYAAPSATTICVTDIAIVNTGASSATFRINLVPPGGSASAANALFYDTLIPPNTTVQWTGAQALAAGGSISALASSTSITFLISGILSS